MFDFLQYVKLQESLPEPSQDFLSEYDEHEFVEHLLEQEISNDQYAFFTSENFCKVALHDLGGHLVNKVIGHEEQRFLKGSHTKTRLASSLAEMGNEGLLKKTLLWPEVSKEHADYIYTKLCRRADKIDEREANKLVKRIRKNGTGYKRGEKRVQLFSTHQSFKFLTIVHKVVPLCDHEAVNEVKRMMYQLKEAFAKVPEVSCLGAAECEIISIPKMREIRAATTDKIHNQIDSDMGCISTERAAEINENIRDQEYRKLRVCEGLSSIDKVTLYDHMTSEILVHFHAVVCAPSEAKFRKLHDVLHANPNWKIEPRQIELKALTKKYGKKEKSVTDNFHCISQYIVKGGNDWIGKKAYLRYKIRFSNDMPLSDDEIENLNWRTNNLLKLDSKETKHVEDLLSLSVYEINILTKTINGIMNLKSDRKGYIFRHGRW